MRQQRQAKAKRGSAGADVLISENRAAQLLERDRQTIKRALRAVEPDGYEQGQPRWRVGTVMRAVAAHSSHTGRARSSGACSIEPELMALEQADLNVKAFLKRLRAEPDVRRRRAIVKSAGKVIGALDEAFGASIAAQGPDAATVYTPFRNEVVASAINELMSLCKWKLAL
jgi:hypothetical protein